METESKYELFVQGKHPGDVDEEYYILSASDLSNVFCLRIMRKRNFT